MSTLEDNDLGYIRSKIPGIGYNQIAKIVQFDYSRPWLTALFLDGAIMIHPYKDLEFLDEFDGAVEWIRATKGDSGE